MNATGVHRTGGKFTYTWGSREVVLRKDTVKLDLKDGFNLESGRKEVEETSCASEFARLS